jgi:hypothetical protein
MKNEKGKMKNGEPRADAGGARTVSEICSPTNNRVARPQSTDRGSAARSGQKNLVPGNASHALLVIHVLRVADPRSGAVWKNHE